MRALSVVAVLTTFDRPQHLRRTLPRILDQLEESRVPLVIADDHSTDEETLFLVEKAAEHRGAILTRRPPDRRLKLHPHFRIGRTMLHAVRFVSRRWPRAKLMLKLDDDAWLGHNAVTEMLSAWRNAEKTWGKKLVALSGITTKNEQFMDGDCIPGNFVRVSASCSVAVLHRMAFLRAAFSKIGAKHVVNRGWDCTFWWEWAFPNGERSNGRVACMTKRSVVYHLAHTGVHLVDQDVNRTDSLGFKGWHPQGDNGGMPNWQRMYGGRRHRPDGRTLK